jgi:hypothetical protein
VWRYARESALTLLTPPGTHPPEMLSHLEREILALAAAAPDGLTRRELIDRTSRNYPVEVTLLASTYQQPRLALRWGEVAGKSRFHRRRGGRLGISPPSRISSRMRGCCYRLREWRPDRPRRAIVVGNPPGMVRGGRKAG